MRASSRGRLLGKSGQLGNITDIYFSCAVHRPERIWPSGASYVDVLRFSVRIFA